MPSSINGWTCSHHPQNKTYSSKIWRLDEENIPIILDFDFQSHHDVPSNKN